MQNPTTTQKFTTVFRTATAFRVILSADMMKHRQHFKPTPSNVYIS